MRIVTPSENAALFVKLAQELGFARIGFSPVSAVARHRLYTEWLAAGRAADMHYLHEQSAEREHPGRLFDAAETVIAVALSYAHPEAPIAPERLARGIVARYARGDDYHHVLKAKLHALAERAGAVLGRSLAYRACVDTAPLLEREAAHASGIGFIAKNTMLIAPGVGSYVVLGELLTDVPCAADAPAEPRCGQCRACIAACPTGALVDEYVLDARRCISYLTIENEGEIPREFRTAMHDRIYGCDICQEVCPYNARESGGAPELAPRAGVARPVLRELVVIGAAQFRKWQRNSAIRRVHRPQLQRNAAVALGNIGTAEDLPALVVALYSNYPLVRAHAAWAIAQIGRRENPTAAHSLLRRRAALERTPQVQTELTTALSELGTLSPQLRYENHK